MLTRWLHVRLKAAEKALRQGRIDDAVAATQQPELRDHPRGQKLLDELVKPLVARARLHCQAGRYRDALTDLDRLAAMGRAGPDVQALRQRIAEEMRQGAQHSADQRQAVDRAADCLRAGRLDTGRLNVEHVDDTRQREQLAQELDHRVQRAGQLLEQAAEALERGDVLGAVRLWEDACQRQGRTQETDRLAARLVDAGRQALDGWHAQGRIERLLAARAAVAALLSYDPTLADCERLVELCGRAASQLAAADYAGLRQTLLRVKAARGEVAWVNAALDALARIAEGQDVLMASPLGLFASDAGHHAQPAGGLAERAAETRPPTLDARVMDANAIRLVRPLLMLVDGGGSSLLVAGDLVRIGRAGTTAEIDVPMPAELESHHADIVRRGDDYFLTAYGPARLNDQPVEHTLLHDGDRIVLGETARMTFHKPSSKSESAVLRLSHRCRLASDVSDIVLFRETCVIGPAASCHVRTREDNDRVVLFERGGTLCARQIAGTGHWSAPAQAVVPGRTLEFGGLRLTVKPYEV